MTYQEMIDQAKREDAARNAVSYEIKLPQMILHDAVNAHDLAVRYEILGELDVANLWRSKAREALDEYEELKRTLE